MAAKKLVAIVMSTTFWSSILNILKLSGPLVFTLRLVNGEKSMLWHIYMLLWRTPKTLYLSLLRVIAQNIIMSSKLLISDESANFTVLCMKLAII